MPAKKSAARASRGQESRLQDDAGLDGVLPLIERRKQAGITLKEIQAEIPGPEKALKTKLTGLVKEGAIVSIKYGTPKKEDWYFAPGWEPTIESVSTKVASLVKKEGSSVPVTDEQLKREITGIDSVFLLKAIAHALKNNEVVGPFFKEKIYLPATASPPVVCTLVVRLAQEAEAKPPSEKDLAKHLKGVEPRILQTAIKKAVDSRAVLPLKCGTAMFYVHRDVALKHFGASAAAGVATSSGEAVTFEVFLHAYRRLKAEQRGLSTVYISSLLQVLGVAKEALHPLLLKETKAGRVTIHPSTILEPAEVRDAGIKVEGFAEPYVTVVVRDAS